MDTTSLGVTWRAAATSCASCSRRAVSGLGGGATARAQPQRQPSLRHRPLARRRFRPNLRSQPRHSCRVAVLDVTTRGDSSVSGGTGVRRAARRRVLAAAVPAPAEVAETTRFPAQKPATSQWDAAWGSVKERATRVAYIDDADRRTMLAALNTSGLRELLAATEGESHVKASISTANPEGGIRALGLMEALLGSASCTDPVTEGIGLLERDACEIVRAFGRVTGETTAVVSFSLLRQTLCSKLHVDHVPLRVMVTYFGAGTEVLSERASLAVSLAGKLGGYTMSDVAKFLAGTVASPPKQAGACEVVILKGERWPGNEGKAIVHRSPDVDGCCGEWRLCLKVDGLRDSDA
mmetsp:Transcript_45025/g.72293  ORF Transcript_45025/g.72293 Transcript_45025/m.72293 type:complete len:351 (-) Transcript_45025:253-1305(-)